MVKCLVLVAIVGGIACNNMARADDSRNGPGSNASDQKSSQPNGLQGLPSPPSADQVGRDYRQIQADFQRIQKDCDDGDYEKAQADLNLLVQHRQKYYADARAGGSSGDSSSAAEAPATTPARSPGTH